MHFSSSQFVSITSKLVIFMISIKISYALTGIDTQNKTIRTIICNVFIAPQSSCSNYEKKKPKTALDVAKPNNDALTTFRITSIMSSYALDAYLSRFYSKV